jgi:pyrimidine-nucleoside phosphorylase
MFHVPQLLEKKREGGELTPEEIEFLVEGFTNGEIPDSQMSAFAMAVCFQDLSVSETAALTRGLMNSGEIWKWPKGSPPKIDKHSTGGIGDKVSLVLAPLLSCEDFWVPMVSGRGLGITGGTLDKLESIPGFQVAMDNHRAIRQLEKTGVIMAGQSDTFCPADRKLYALRDVTGTVPAPALIVASIMSKKLAESLDRLVLDVKFGRGAFMKSREAAESLAQKMQETGTHYGVETTFFLSPMNQPLGRAVGNALEVMEAMQCLQGAGPVDLQDLVLELAAIVSKIPQNQWKKHLTSGAAWEKFERMVECQKGDAKALGHLNELHKAPFQRILESPVTGKVESVDACMIGRLTVRLGGGRAKSSDPVDYAVGFDCIAKEGERVEKGEPLLRIHARRESDLRQWWPEVESCVRVIE